MSEMPCLFAAYLTSSNLFSTTVYIYMSEVADILHKKERLKNQKSREMGHFVHSRKPASLLILFTLVITSLGSNYFEDFDITWGGSRGKIVNNGELLTLSLDTTSGSGFQSKKEFMFGRIDMQIKLVPGNSAGTVTAYYLSSQGPNHDEIDFEFLGNLSAQPYTLHTNVYAQGKGDREQQFRLWFDPTTDFHTYSILWNPQTIVFSVDNTPIREFKNMEKIGVPFPRSQPMKLYSSIWNADEWATRGGLVKIDWTQAPFTAYYRGFSNRPLSPQELGPINQDKLKWVQNNHMIYNYCTDKNRFAQGLPPECNA